METKKLKLNVKNTILVGLAFSSISVLWTTYDFIIPLMLNRTFGLTDSVRGLIMGLDNILALFLLPFFGALSDKTKSKWGRRTPFIVVGTVVAIVLLLILPFVEGSQLKGVEERSNEVTNEELWEFIPKTSINTLISNGNYEMDALNLSDQDNEILKADFLLIEKTIINDEGKTVENSDYSQIVQPAFRSYVYKEITLKNPTTFVFFTLVLFLLIVALGSYRSPVVAFMPDVTPEPLRSPANAIINLMGGIGGGLGMIGYTIFLSTFLKGYYASYTMIFVLVAGLMAILTGVFLGTVREKKLVEECYRICKEHNIDDHEEDNTKIRFRDMPKEHLRNFILILAGIFMCTMSTNAIASSMSVYAVDELRFDAGMASTVSLAGYVLSALAFIPVGFLSTRLGRKRTIILGFGVTIASLILGFFITEKVKLLFILVYVIQNFGGVFIGVNTLPMVLESSNTATLGKFTGLYYTATMGASSITPYLSGLFMEHFSRRVMFIYSAVCMIIAIALFIFVKSKHQPLKREVETNILEGE